MNIYVGNLPYSFTDEQLKAKFSEFGEVTSASVIMDKATGRSKGFGFVEMADDEQAKDALDKLSNWQANGRQVKVNEAKPKEDKPRKFNKPRTARI